MRKENLISKKQDNLLVAVENGAGVLQQNANQSLDCATEGRQLLQRLHKEGGMTESLATETRDYVARCNAVMLCMNGARKPFTQRLTEFQKQFVAQENAIDPTKKGSPAYELTALLNAWLMAKKRDSEAKEDRLHANFQRTEKRIAGRDDLSREQKEAALNRAEGRLRTGRVALRMNEIATDLIPVATDPEGYIDLLRFWWQEIGRNLPDSDLERIFRPMCSYARKQARKGVIVDSVYVEYREVPKGGQAA
ncbi:hypothetical protein [Parabacteroides sp.]